MYCSHFGLHRPPFNNTPDPTFYFSTPEHEEALATLQYATLQRKGFVLVTGEIGAGKTLVGRLFMRQIERDATVAVINHTNLNGQQLLTAICSEFEIETPAGESGPQLLERLQNFLLDQFAKDRYAVVLLDEAQNLPNESFEELRMLGNLEADDAKLLQVCILGQPELRDRIRQPGMRQLDQRLFRRFHLPALNRDQTKAYIQHRLTVAGAPGAELFSEEAIDRIYAASRGVPRVVNQICDNALLTAYGENIKQVSSRIVDRIVENEGVDRRNAWGETDRRIANPYSPRVDMNPAAGGLTGPRIMQTVTESASVVINGQGVPAPAAAAPVLPPEVIELAGRQVEQIAKSREELAALTQQAERTKADLAELGAKAARTQGELSVVTDQATRARQELHDIAAQTSRAREELHTLSEQTSRTRQELEAVTERTARTQSKMTTITGKLKHRWHATQGKLDEYRNEIQSALADAAARYQTIQAQFESLTKTATPTGTMEAVEDVRKGYLQESARILEQITQQRDRFRQLLGDAERRWNETSTRLSELSRGAASKDDLEGLEKDFGHKVSDLLGRFDLHRDQIGELAQSLQELCERTQRDLQTMRNTQAETEARIGQQVASRVVASAQVLERKMAAAQEAQSEAHSRLVGEIDTRITDTRAVLLERLGLSEQRIESLHGQMGERLTSLNAALQHLEGTAASAADLEHFKHSQTEALDDFVRRLTEQGSELRHLRSEVAQNADRGSKEKEEQSAQMARQIAAQEERLLGIRRKVLEHLTGTEQRFESLADKFADRKQVDELREDLTKQLQTLAQESKDSVEDLRRDHEVDLEKLRENQEAKAAEILKRIETNRDSMQKLISTVVQRWESTQRQLETVSASSADKEQLDALRTQSEQESKRLIDELAGHRTAMEEHFSQMTARLQETRTDLDALCGSAARADDLAQVQRQQAEEQERILTALADQRRELDSMVDAVNKRCDDLLGRLTALPPDIATTRQMAVLHRENMDQIRVVARELATRRTQLEQAIRGVAEHSRQTHVAVEALAKRAASVEDVKKLRQQHTDKLRELIGRLENESAKNEHNFSVVAREVAQHAQRVTQLEEMDRPRPIQIKLSPKAGQALASVVESARQRHQQLNTDLARAEEVSSQLQNVSTRIQDVLRHWAEHTENAERQSDKLRNSALTAERIIETMNKCHESLDKKLNSPRWRQELKRGEILADRLEQAAQKAQTATERLQAMLDDINASQSSADEWTTRSREARQLIDRLATLMAEASRAGTRVDETLIKRKQILAAVAQNTAGLIDLIDNARRTDEQSRPTARPAPASPLKAKSVKPAGRADVADIAWPRVRVPAKVG